MNFSGLFSRECPVQEWIARSLVPSAFFAPNENGRQAPGGARREPPRFRPRRQPPAFGYKVRGFWRRDTRAFPANGTECARGPQIEETLYGRGRKSLLEIRWHKPSAEHGVARGKLRTSLCTAQSRRPALSGSGTASRARSSQAIAGMVVIGTQPARFD